MTHKEAFANMRAVRLALAVAAPMLLALPASALEAGKPPDKTSAAPPLNNDVALNTGVNAHNAAIDAQNHAAQAQYDSQKAAYEAEKKKTADAYAAQLAEYQAALDAQTRQHDADMAAWKARVQACLNGHRSKCAK